MNKQNQELRSLSQIVRRDFQKVAEDNKSMLERFEELSNSPSCKYIYAVDRYKDLSKAINFTKIADMTYLVTHYGAVSEERIEESTEFESKKRLADLLARKSHADKYLKQYNLQKIDNVLDIMFSDPIKSRGKEAWYTVASRMILGAFDGIELALDDKLENLYFTDEEGERRRVSNFSIASFEEFLMITAHTSKIFDYQTDWSEKYLKRFVANLLADDRFRTNESQKIED